jgi:hypothetical protein
VSSDPVPARHGTGRRRLLRCNVCSRTVECSKGELLRFTREGWPRCCAAVMFLFIEADANQADGMAD